MTTLVMLVVLNGLLWTLTGFGVCWATHRQRGMEADRLDIVWPDTVPDWLADWVDGYPDGAPPAPAGTLDDRL
jgi:hypothetical protein